MRTSRLPPTAVPQHAPRSGRLPPAQRWLRQGGLALLLAGLLQATSGCTVVGAMVGATYPKYETVPDERVREIPPGTEVEVDAAEVTRMRDNVARTSTPAGPLRGDLIDNRGRYIVLRTGSDTTTFVDRRYALDVKVHKGSYAGTGALVGVFIDLAVLATLAASASGSWSRNSRSTLGASSAH